MGIGFAELQVGDDSGGFHFSGVGATGVETAGPEVGASLRLLHHAPRLTVPQSTFQPGVSLSLGLGF